MRLKRRLVLLLNSAKLLKKQSRKRFVSALRLKRVTLRKQSLAEAQSVVVQAALAVAVALCFSVPQWAAQVS
jgi:hypothetical protein